VHVANEVDDELGSLFALPCRQLAIERLLGIVGERTDDAAFVFAIAIKVDAAVGRRAIVGIDEVEIFGKATPVGVTDGVSPRRDLGEVVRFVAAEELLEEALGRVGDEVASEVCGGDMAETCVPTLSALASD
jgi:hypothetical protein